MAALEKVLLGDLAAGGTVAADVVAAIVLTATPVVIGMTIEPGRLGQQVGGHAYGLSVVPDPNGVQVVS